MTRGSDENAFTFLDGIARDALLGDHAHAKQSVLAAESLKLQVRGANLLSAVVHEQRHFVDVLLTNFGQSLFRQFSTIWVNVPCLGEGGATPAPMAAAADPIRRRLLGLDPCPEPLVRIATDILARNRMLEPDVSMEDFGAGGQISMGGRAQLEALGFLSQFGFLTREFGPDVHGAVLQDMPDEQRFWNEYAWITAFSESLGLQGTDGTVNHEGLAAFLYGTLMTRRWGQAQTEVDGGDSFFAAARLDPLFVRLRETQALGRAGSIEDAWGVVNDACEDAFGRSALDELQADLAHEANFIDAVMETTGDESPVSKFLTAVHGARRQLASLLETSPALVLSPLRFVELLQRIDPVPIVVSAQGAVEPSLPGWREMWAVEEQFGVLGKQRWHHAAAPLDLLASDDRINVVGDAEVWLAIVMELAPLSKLLIRGRQFPTMLAAEYEYAEHMFNSRGDHLLVDPMYARPLVDTSASAFWYFTEQDEARCDTCYAVLVRGEGSFLSALEVRLSDRLIDWMFLKYGGLEFPDEARLALARDHQGWLTCHACHTEIRRILDGAPNERIN